MAEIRRIRVGEWSALRDPFASVGTGARGFLRRRMVAEALKAYFALPPVPTPPPPPELAEQLRQVQAYLWDLHFSHECTRAASLNLYYWAQRSGENMGMPPEQEMEKPPWTKPGN